MSRILISYHSFAWKRHRPWRPYHHSPSRVVNRSGRGRRRHEALEGREVAGRGIWIDRVYCPDPALICPSLCPGLATEIGTVAGCRDHCSRRRSVCGRGRPCSLRLRLLCGRILGREEVYPRVSKSDLPLCGPLCVDGLM